MLQNAATLITAKGLVRPFVSHGRPRRTIAAFVLAAGALAAPPASAEILDTLKSLIPFSESSPSSGVQQYEEDDVECPRVDVYEGGAALQAFASREAHDPPLLMNQITIGETARECTKGADGTTIIKVGVGGRVMLGPAGKPGTFKAPLNVVIRRGDKVVAHRSRQVSMSIAAGETAARFSVVEDGLVAPAGHGDLAIEIGLGKADLGEGQARERGRKAGKH